MKKLIKSIRGGFKYCKHCFTMTPQKNGVCSICKR